MFRSFDPDDNLSRLSGVYQGTGTTTPLATFAYANNGLVSSRSEGSTGASSATYGWDDINRLTSQSDAFSGGTNNVAWTFAYNPASQITTETRNNDSYGFTKSTVTTAYAVNGLNQYSSVGGTAHAYDPNGNLTGDGSKTYTYDIENRLVKAVAGGTTNLIYDPLGRLFKVNQGLSGITRFLNDGDAMVAEFGSVNTVTHRFVHGSSAPGDDPLVWYSGSGLTNKRWLHADRLGSLVAWTNSSGGSPTINRYDEYGAPAATNTGRFQYTGQAWIGELGLYYYKARFYSPVLGRFLQTDPVAYEDNFNLYAYVGNDPLNSADSTGLAAQSCGSRIPGQIEAGCFGVFVEAGGTLRATGGPLAGQNVDPSRLTPPTAPNAASVGQYYGGYYIQTPNGLIWHSNAMEAGVKLATIAATALGGEILLSARGMHAALQSTRLFKAVERAELADIGAAGGMYRVPEGISGGKYFYPTSEQAVNFARLNPGRSYTLTSSRFPNSVLSQSWTSRLPAEGKIFFIPTEHFPHGPVTIGVPIP